MRGRFENVYKGVQLTTKNQVAINVMAAENAESILSNLNIN